MRFLYSIVAAILLLFYGGIPAFGQVSISGTVKDDADNPIIGATLTLISTGNQIAATNSNGLSRSLFRRDRRFSCVAWVMRVNESP